MVKPPSIIADEICRKVANGDNIVSAIVSLRYPMMETLNMMADFEGDLMDARKKARHKIRVTYHSPQVIQDGQAPTEP